MLLTYTIDQRMMNMVKNGAFLFNKKFGVVMNDFSRATFWQNPGDKTEYPSLEFADDGYTGQFDGDIDTNIERVSYLPPQAAEPLLLSPRNVDEAPPYEGCAYLLRW